MWSFFLKFWTAVSMLNLFLAITLINSIGAITHQENMDLSRVPQDLKIYFENFKDCTVQVISPDSGVVEHRVIHDDDGQYITFDSYTKYFHDQFIPCIRSGQKSIDIKLELGEEYIEEMKHKYTRKVQPNETAVILRSKDPYSLGSRFTQCLVQLYDMKSLLHIFGTNANPEETQDTYMTLLSLMQGVLYDSQQPNFIVLAYNKGYDQEERNSSEHALEAKFYMKLRFLVTKPILHVINESSSIYQVCQHCQGKAMKGLLSPLNNDESKESIKIQWNTLNRNILGESVIMMPGPSISNKEKEYKFLSKIVNYVCSGGHRGVGRIGKLFQLSDCSHEILKQQLNITIVGPEVWSVITPLFERPELGFVLTTPAMTNHLFQFLLHPSHKFSWLTTVETFDVYTFIVIVDRDQLNFSIFWRPFDDFIWLLYVLSLLIVPLTVYIFSYKKFNANYDTALNKDSEIKISHSIWMSLSIVLEQCQLSVIKVTKKGYRVGSLLVLALWILSSVTLDSAYKGKLVSFLSSSIVPSVPKTLVELTSPYSINDYFIGSANTFFTPATFKFQSAIKYGILSSFIKNDTSPTNPFKVLFEKLVYLPSEDHQIVYTKLRQPEQVPLPLIPNRSSIEPREDEKKIPNTLPLDKDLVLMGKLFELKSFGELFQHFGPDLIVVFSNPIDGLSDRMPWLVSNNFMEPFITSTMRQLYESGIYEKWKTLFQSKRTTSNFRLLSKLYEKENSKHKKSAEMSSSEKTTKRSSPRVKCRNKGHAGSEEAKPLSLKTFRVIFLLSTCFTAFTVIVFLAELVIHKVN